MENMEAGTEIIKRMMESLGQTSPTSKTPSSTFECQLCKDQEFIMEKDDEGRLVARECQCRAVKHARRLLEQSGLAGLVEKQTFDNFTVNTPSQKAMSETAKRYLEDLLSRRGTKSERVPWLYIGGNPGAGKTHICTAVCGELLKNDIPVKYMQWVTESRALKFVSGEDYEDSAAEFIKPAVLYIDDLLKQKWSPNPQFTEADIKIAFTILNARYYMNKPTIISSEWDLLEHLLSADEGTFSRVYERSKGYTVIIDRKRDNDYRLSDGGSV